MRSKGLSITLSVRTPLRPDGIPDYDWYLAERGTTRAGDAHGTPTQSRISPSILVYEDYPLPGQSRNFFGSGKHQGKFKANFGFRGNRSFMKVRIKLPLPGLNRQLDTVLRTSEKT